MLRLPPFCGSYGIGLLKHVCRYLLVVIGVLAPLQSVQAVDTPPLTFAASYEILSPSGDRIGSYFTSIKGPGGPTGSTYELSGRFELSFKTLVFFNYVYSSIDSVSYDANGIEKFQIIEDDKGKRTVVTGSRSMDKTRLRIVEKQDREGAEAVSSTILNSSYDYSLFAFRFPSPCTNHATGSARELKILRPRTGQVTMIRSESVPVDDPHTTEHGAAKCRLITRDRSNKVIKESYFLGEGILVFEKTPEYQMRLTGITHESNK